MKDRILKLLAEEKISASEFADKMGIQRSNVSHILNGRNNPGYSFIQKILETFPLINPRWLITGEGSIYQGEGMPSAPVIKSKGLFSDQSINEISFSEKLSVDEVTSDLIEKSITVKKNQNAENQDIIQRKVVRVMFIYNDHTFEDFLPAEKI
jgi:transcriptional regulator with XRE-family HTH domain